MNYILEIFTSISIFLPLTASIHFNYPVVFNFGDSNSDTGNLIAAGIESINPPYGQIHFKKPSGRYCDGRLIIDFLSKSPNSVEKFHAHQFIIMSNLFPSHKYPVCVFS